MAPPSAPWMHGLAPDEPVLPRYGTRSVCELVPALVTGYGPDWLPATVTEARQVVLLVLDGLGRLQLDERTATAPTMAGMGDGWLTTVAPTTTATALTSITTGVPPGEHGVVGYRMRTRGDVLNCLRWQLDDDGDARRRLPAHDVQPVTPFLGAAPTVVTKREFETTGFTDAHLRGTAWSPWSVPSGIVASVDQAIRAGARLVYAYYDGVDKVSHLHGLGQAFDLEVGFADHLVRTMLATLPEGTAVVVTADHGQVHVGDAEIDVRAELGDALAGMSGEGRFRWLHARDGRRGEVLDRALAAFGAQSWVRSVEQIIDERWFGPVVSDAARARLGDVALVPFEPVSFHDPADSGAFDLIGRHGSMTAAETIVPLLIGVATG